MDAIGFDQGQPVESVVNGNQKPQDDDSKDTAGGNKFQEAVSVWRNIDLTHLMPTLDSTASDLVLHQRDSLVQRKELAQKTKDFRKLDDANKLTEIKSLLKAYQTFIDLLTNQSKATSSGFLKVYSLLSEAPDPYPLLEASIDSLLVSEDTVPKITNENKELQQTVSKLTSQLENSEKRLEAEATARKSIEDGQESKIKEVEASWTAVLEEKKDNWASKEKSLEEKVESQDRLLKEVKASYEVSQRLDRSESVESEGPPSGAMAAELEMINADLERTSMRLAEVESRNEQLRVELAQSASQSQQHSSTSTEESPAFIRLQSENSSLLRKLDASRSERESQKRELETKVKSMERQIASIRQDRDSLKEKVQSWSDYDDVKRELEMLRSIEFATGEENDTGDEDDEALTAKAANGAASTGKSDSLEQLLLTRNKKLANELTVLRVSHRDLQDRLQALQEESSTTNTDLEKSKDLNAQLENDLLKVQQEASNAFQSSAMSVAGTYTSRHPGTSSYGGGRRGRSSPTSSIISGFDPHGGSSASLEAIRAGEPVGGGSGILPMITAQRDRFKQRNSQLEDELSKTYHTVSSLRQEIASLQKDNLGLYEKTRYVSTYNRSQPTAAATTKTTTSSSSYSSNPNPSTIQVSSSSTPSGLSLDRYRSAYEANLSPFAAFRGRESARAYKRMRLPERIVFSVTRMVMANRTSRNFFALYCLALHLLVFAMLYWMGTADIEQHASNLGQQALGSGSSGGGAAAVAAAAGAAGPLVGAGAEDSIHGDWHQEGFSGGG